MAAAECYEFHPPIEIIQHIQSFLNGKQAARTSIISKTWYTSWLTRPHLVFDMRDFQIRHKEVSKRTRKRIQLSDKFTSFYKKTIQRYKESNLMVEKFTFVVNDVILADELIAHALKLGVNDLQVGIEVKPGSPKAGRMDYMLHVQVFALTSLTQLSLTYCDINHLIDGGIFCSRLKSLSLQCVKIKDQVLWDILHERPLIQDLDLTYCMGLETLNVSKMHKLAKLLVSGEEPECREDLVTAFTTNSQINEFRYLRQLHLKRVTINKEFFTEFSSRFPCIEDLSIRYSCGYKEINISSRSLKYLSLRLSSFELRRREMLKGIQFNVPNISKFVLETDYHIPVVLSFFNF